MWLVSGALLIAFATYVALPLGLAWYLPQYAAQYGIRLEVERARVEPFSSTLKLSGVRVAASGGSSIKWSNVETRIDLAELASGRLVLDGFRLSEAKLRAGDPGMDATGVLPKVPAALPEDVSVGELVIDGVELATASEALGHRATIDWLRISSLDGVFRPEGAEIEANLSVGKGRSRLRGRVNLDESGWILNAAEIVANDVPLDGLPTLLGADGAWRGRLDGTGPVRLVYSPINGAFSATAGGRWAIEGLELGLAEIEILGARVDWNGAAFMMSSGDGLDTLSVDGEIGLREIRIGVADMLEIEAAEIVLQVDASQAPETRLSVEGHIPVARLTGKGGAFEGVHAQATNLASRVALRIDDDIGVDVDWLKSGAFGVTLPADRSIELEQVELERVVVAPASNAVSAAAGTVQRAVWRGFTGPRRTGTATQLAIERIERHGNGEIQLALASAESVEDRQEDSVLRLREVALDSTTFSPAATLAVGAARIADVWLASETSTLVLERLTLDGVQRSEAGAVRIASGRAHLVDHARTGDCAIVGTELELAGGAVSGRTWEAEHVRLGEVDIEIERRQLHAAHARAGRCYRRRGRIRRPSRNARDARARLWRTPRRHERPCRGFPGVARRGGGRTNDQGRLDCARHRATASLALERLAPDRGRDDGLGTGERKRGIAGNARSRGRAGLDDRRTANRFRHTGLRRRIRGARGKRFRGADLFPRGRRIRDRRRRAECGCHRLERRDAGCRAGGSAADERHGRSGPCIVRCGRIHLDEARSRRYTRARNPDLRIRPRQGGARARMVRRRPGAERLPCSGLR